MGPGVALAVVAVSTLLSMSVWFSASFVLPQLKEEWGLSPGSGALLTVAVQLGFVVGAVSSAMSGLADRVANRFLMCGGAVGAAAANGGVLLADGLWSAVVLRLVTGFFLAAVYPPALKETATWFRAGRGKALGVMIGALTVGSALPHAVNAAGGVDWHLVIAVTSLMGACGGVLALSLRWPGPYPFPRRRVTVGGALRSLRNRDVVLADLGYVGHMWELYAMWGTVASLLASVPVVEGSGRTDALASTIAFVCIGVGAFGCLLGGVLGDRWGRASAARICLVCSGGAALLLAVGVDAMPSGLVIAVCVFWGFWVVADSAQFSALVTERADPDYVGGALSLQLALGYSTTAVTLWGVPVLVEHTSWRVALLVLVVGPVVGVVAMSRSIVRDRRAAAVA
ncbi:MFS transporter [Streptomyces sp. NBC_01016]|uniref:MFS transporter n=1 Tax=Streptomyces sp. NBC_01016 TaxID=2903720 RepID=UPI002257C7DC|nr:MFS transporter [Streptomyces sp. NBC_01016]MCX4835187.1 MFS transporter [Streptomyces sp. NBC_01016]